MIHGVRLDRRILFFPLCKDKEKGTVSGVKVERKHEQKRKKNRLFQHSLRARLAGNAERNVVFLNEYCALCAFIFS